MPQPTTHTDVLIPVPVESQQEAQQPKPEVRITLESTEKDTCAEAESQARVVDGTTMRSASTVNLIKRKISGKPFEATMWVVARSDQDQEVTVDPDYGRATAAPQLGGQTFSWSNLGAVRSLDIEVAATLGATKLVATRTNGAGEKPDTITLSVGGVAYAVVTVTPSVTSGVTLPTL